MCRRPRRPTPCQKQILTKRNSHSSKCLSRKDTHYLTYTKKIILLRLSPTYTHSRRNFFIYAALVNLGAPIFYYVAKFVKMYYKS